MSKQAPRPRVGLVLAGGGARAAYQVGVLKAIAEMLPAGVACPFPVLCGTSAGAINATALAIYAVRFHAGVRRLNYVWRNFRVHQVYRADALGILKTGAHWLAALLAGGLGRRNPRSLLDRRPLRALLEQTLACDEIQSAIDAGALHALGITCSGYTSEQSVTFYQGVPALEPWQRSQRVGRPARITFDHLMASSSIPFLFEPVRVGREYYGDGSMRQDAPLSPALHLGADRILVIGVRYDAPVEPLPPEYPSLAQIAGHVLNSIFLDALDADVERARRINEIIRLIHQNHIKEDAVTLRPVDVLVVSPSEDLEDVAAKYAHQLPRPVRTLFRRLGALQPGGANLISYLLFEKDYCRALIGLGYADAMLRRKELLEFIALEGR